MCTLRELTLMVGVTVDYQVLFNIVLGAVAFLGGYVVNNITTSLNKLSTDLKELDSKHQVTRETYVPKVDHIAEMTELKHRFDTLDSKLDGVGQNVAVLVASANKG